MTAGAGHTEDRQRASGARPMGIKGEKERGQTAADSHHGTHGSRRIRGQAEGREGNADGHAPGEWRRSTAAGERSRERTKKRYINI